VQCCASAFHISSAPLYPEPDCSGRHSSRRSTSGDQSPTLDDLCLVSDREVPSSTSKCTEAGHDSWRHLVRSRKPNPPFPISAAPPTALCILILCDERTFSSFFLAGRHATAEEINFRQPFTT